MYIINDNSLLCWMQTIYFMYLGERFVVFDADYIMYRGHRFSDVLNASCIMYFMYRGHRFSVVVNASCMKDGGLLCRL